MEEEKAKKIEDKVIEIIAEQMGRDKSEIKPETSFEKDLNADSLDLVELVMEFEDEFNMKISDEDASKMLTVGEVITYAIKYTKDDYEPK